MDTSTESDMDELSSSSDDPTITKRLTTKDGKKRRWAGPQFPDDSKCDYCFRQGRRCDGERPCHSCVKKHRGGRCVDQTPETKKLVPKKNREARPALLHASADAEKCRRCTQTGRRCVRPDGEGTDCTTCKKQGRLCNNDLTGVNEKKSQAKSTRVPVDKKCDRCFRRGTKCDGKEPCSSCGDKHKCYSQEHRKEVMETPKCTRCQREKRACDRKRPCSVCIKAERNCFYLEQEGLVKRTYVVETAPQYRGRTAEEMDLIKEESDDECGLCIFRKRNCSGFQPCHQCVRQQLRDPSKPVSCQWKRSKGVIESYDARPYHIQDDGEIILKSDHKEQVRRTDIQKKPRKAGNTQTNETVVLASTTQTEGSRARQYFDLAFPNGHEIIPTASSGLECGFHAIINSMAAQFPSLAQPTLRELQEVFRSPEFTQQALEFGLTNTNNFTVDQIAAVAHLWASTRHGLNLQLGYIIEEREPILVATEGDDRDDRVILWIHNDNAQDIALAEGRRVAGLLNHFSGLRRSQLGRLPRSTERRKRPRKEISESDTESSDENEISTRRARVDDDLDLFGPQSSDADHTQNRTSHAMTAYTDMSAVPEPENYAQAMRAPDAGKWEEAIRSEHDSLIQNNTWDVVVLPADRKALTSRWVFKRKIGADGCVSRYKARLVARGCQQVHGIDFEETFAAVVKPSSYKVLFALSAALGWQCEQMDVKTAFLNGELESEVYVKAPPGIQIPRGKVLRLRRALYGLKQSPRTWYDKFRKTIEKWGWQVSLYDPCVFLRPDLGLYVALWVDDILLFGVKHDPINAFKAQLAQTFAMTDDGECSYYLGMHVNQGPGFTHIHQQKYAEQKLAAYGLENIAPVKTPGDPSVKLSRETESTADPDFKAKYQSMVGSLMYLATVSRPDLCFSTNLVARYNPNPNQSHMDATTRVYAYLNGTLDKGLWYSEAFGTDLVGYVDSDHAGCEDTRRSTTGWVFMLGGSPVSWCSQRQKTVALSTCDAEYIAASEACKEALWLKGFINDLRIPEYIISTVPLYIDNDPALKLAKNPEFHSKTKHIDIRYHFIREKVESKDIIPIRVDTDNNLADILTKPLARPKHQFFSDKMGLKQRDHGDSGGVGADEAAGGV